MMVPTPTEFDAFLDRLRQQGSFLQDPAIVDAIAFLERCRPAVVGYAERVVVPSAEDGG